LSPPASHHPFFSFVDIEGVDSDVDTNALKQSDSEDDKPRRKQKPRPKASDFPERRYEKMMQQQEAGGGGPGRGRPPSHPSNRGGMARGGAWGSGAGQQQQQTVRMEPGFGDVPYTLTGGVPDWCDFEPQYEDDGSRTLEAVLGRRKIDRTKPNNGLKIVATDGASAKSSKSGSAGGGSVPAPAKAAVAASAEASDNDNSEDDEGADESKYYYVVKMRCATFNKVNHEEGEVQWAGVFVSTNSKHDWSLANIVLLASFVSFIIF